MNFLRRGSRATEPAPVDAPDTDTDGADEREVVAVGDRRAQSAGKGRPTRSRKEAQGKRRGPVAPAPKTQREAFKRQKSLQGSKAERRTASDDRRKRMKAGDERVLPTRDRGPVRAFARDVVDSRRNLMGLFMPMAVLVFVTILIPDRRIQTIGSVLCMVMLLTMALEGVLLGRHVVGRARRKFPDETVKGPGLGWYAFTRATQIRRLRMPASRVKPGTTVD